MANVNIKFNGKDYLLSCDDGQEENLKELANHLSNKFNIYVCHLSISSIKLSVS